MIFKGQFTRAIFCEIFVETFVVLTVTMKIAGVTSGDFRAIWARFVTAMSQKFRPLVVSFGKSQQIAANVAPESHRNRRWLTLAPDKVALESMTKIAPQIECVNRL